MGEDGLVRMVIGGLWLPGAKLGWRDCGSSDGAMGVVLDRS